MKTQAAAQQIITAIFFMLILTVALPALGEILTIDEDFSSTVRRDSLASTAVWDTLQLNAHLPQEVLVQHATLATTTAYFSAWDAGHLFLADGPGGLRSIDLDDPDNPVSLQAVPCADQAKGVALTGGHAFVAIGSHGMQVIDVSDPEAMVDRGRFDPDNQLRYVAAVAAEGAAVYLAESDSGVTVVDVSDPASPILDHRLDSGIWARDVHVAGGLLYVADTDLKIYSLDDPLAPELVSVTPVTGTPWRVSVAGGRAFVACAAEGLQIFDISDPAAPQVLGTVDLWGSCQFAAATTSGDTVCVAAGVEGMTVLDVSDPTSPVEIGTRDTIQAAIHILYHDGLILLANVSDGLKIYELDAAGLDGSRNRIQTRDLNPGGDPLARVALDAAIADSVLFSVSADGGNSWSAITPGGDWLSLAGGPVDIRWRAELQLHEGSPPEGPRVYSVSLTLDRLSSHPVIDAVQDVPADDGGQVRLGWLASRHDDPGGDYLITEYSIYRRYDGADRGAPPEPAYPPGQWDFLTSVPADMEDQYAAVVPTLADSNGTGPNWSVFFVRARTDTPGIFFDSTPDSGYSVNNLQPAPPTGLIIAYDHPQGTNLSWDAPACPDFAHFRIYRTLIPGQMPSPGTLFAVTTGTDYLDETAQHYFYQLTLVDQAGHESDPTGQLSSVAPAAPDLSLVGNHPNPFNPSTEIIFQGTPQGGPIRLEIFDARGRRVRTYTRAGDDGALQRLRWDGRDARGGDCGSGLYMLRVAQGSAQRLGKMLLLR